MYKYNSSPLAADPPGQLDILGHDSHPLGVDGTEVGVLEEPNEVGLASLLESHHSGALEPQVRLEVLSNLTDKTLEGQLADEEFGGFLVTTDLTESHCSGPVTMGFLDSSSGWGTLTSGLGSQLFSWGFTTS